jgi:hypothetical protein
VTKSALLVMAVGGMMASCMTDVPANLEDRTLQVGCDDVVVIGRLKNGEFEHVEIDGDILGHGWISARLRVQRVVRGPRVKGVVPVRYFAHTYMREDRDFMFVATPTDEKGYEIASAQLVSARPILASHCSERRATPGPGLGRPPAPSVAPPGGAL